MKLCEKESFKAAFLKQIIHHLGELSISSDTKQTNKQVLPSSSYTSSAAAPHKY